MKNIKAKNLISLVLAVFLLVSSFCVYAEEEPTYSITHDNCNNFVAKAREEYVKPEYQDYTSSIVLNYATTTKASKSQDVTLAWDAVKGERSYTLYLSESPKFDDGFDRVFADIIGVEYTVNNLKANTRYYYKAIARGGQETKVYSFKTSNTVRWLTVNSISNVRDIGGWNGLNQNMVFRGTEINEVDHGKNGSYYLTEGGLDVMRNILKIQSDVDLRGYNIKLTNYITESPLGADKNFFHVGLSSYKSAVLSGTTGKTLKYFTNSDNYPLYIHCWGGADRTGVLCYLLETLCGVSEVDACIDYELTTLSGNKRPRTYGEGSDSFKSIPETIKTFNGDTLQEQTEDLFLTKYGFTWGEISNIRSMLKGNGVTLKNPETNIGLANEPVEIELKNIEKGEIESVDLNGAPTVFSVDGSKVKVIPKKLGVCNINFEDGTVLTLKIKGTGLENSRKLIVPDGDATYDGSKLTASFTNNMDVDDEFYIIAKFEGSGEYKTQASSKMKKVSIKARGKVTESLDIVDIPGKELKLYAFCTDNMEPISVPTVKTK